MILDQLLFGLWITLPGQLEVNNHVSNLVKKAVLTPQNFFIFNFTKTKQKILNMTSIITPAIFDIRGQLARLMDPIYINFLIGDVTLVTEQKLNQIFDIVSSGAMSEGDHFLNGISGINKKYAIEIIKKINEAISERERERILLRTEPNTTTTIDEVSCLLLFLIYFIRT